MTVPTAALTAAINRIGDAVTPRDISTILEAARPHMQERITTAARLDVFLNCDRNVIVIDDDGMPFQNLWGGWKGISMASFLTSERLHCAFGPRFTVIHIGPEEA